MAIGKIINLIKALKEKLVERYSQQGLTSDTTKAQTPCQNMHCLDVAFGSFHRSLVERGLWEFVVDGSEKEYPQSITHLLRQISELTVTTLKHTNISTLKSGSKRYDADLTAEIFFTHKLKDFYTIGIVYSIYYKYHI